MKIQLTTTEEQIDGYFWASPQNTQFHGNFHALNDCCYNGQATEIYGPVILDSIEGAQVEQLIKGLADLLAFNGKIVIGGTDPHILAKQLVDRNISVAEFNHLLFSDKSTVKGMHPLPFIKGALQRHNIKVTDIVVDYSEGLYTIEGIRQ